MRKRKPSKFRIIDCKICGKQCETNHSQGKYCSDCLQQSLRNSWNKYSAKNRLDRRENSKRYYSRNKDKETARIKVYQSTERGKEVKKLSDQRQREKYPEKYQARQEVLKALRKGLLIKKPCEKCGAEKVEAHHDDYKKPLSVRWLCRDHHDELHKKLRK